MEERAEHCFNAVLELGLCTVLLPWLNAGIPWFLLVAFFHQ